MTFVSLNAVCCKFHHFVIFFNVLTFFEEKNSISTRICRDFELFESLKKSFRRCFKFLPWLFIFAYVYAIVRKYVKDKGE